MSENAAPEREKVRSRKDRSVAITAVLLFMIVASFTITAFGIKSNSDVATNQAEIINDQAKIIRQQTAQVKFLCKTSGSLALVLETAADQIDESFKNGTYEKLLEKGIIKPINLQRARETRDRYNAQVDLLRSPDSPCKEKGSK